MQPLASPGIKARSKYRYPLLKSLTSYSACKWSKFPIAGNQMKRRYSVIPCPNPFRRNSFLRGLFSSVICFAIHSSYASLNTRIFSPNLIILIAKSRFVYAMLESGVSKRTALHTVSLMTIVPQNGQLDCRKCRIQLEQGTRVITLHTLV